MWNDFLTEKYKQPKVVRIGKIRLSGLIFHMKCRLQMSLIWHYDTTMIIWWQDDNDGDNDNDDDDDDDFLLQSRLQMSLSLDAGNSHLPHQGIFKGRELQIGFILSHVLFVKMGHLDLKRVQICKFCAF